MLLLRLLRSAVHAELSRVQGSALRAEPLAGLLCARTARRRRCFRLCLLVLLLLRLLISLLLLELLLLLEDLGS